MPTVACVYFYDCKGCGAVLRPKPGDCCVFCSYGTVPTLAPNSAERLRLSGVRAICIRSTGMPETETIDVVFGLHADAMDITREPFQGFIEGMTHRRRSTTVAEVAETAAFLASDRGSGFAGTVANLTGGLIVD